MKPTEVIRGYIDAWNGRDAGTLVAAFTKMAPSATPLLIPESAEKRLLNS
jgi:hypothetical protein